MDNPTSYQDAIGRSDHQKWRHAVDEEILGTRQKKVWTLALLHLANTVRPDISLSVAKLARFCSDPKGSHWIAAKRVLRYLKKTVDLGIIYRSGPNLELIGYVDSDFAGDQVDRKSTTGYVFKLSHGAVTWRPKKQTIVALSTTEAEYVALYTAARENIG